MKENKVLNEKNARYGYDLSDQLWNLSIFIEKKMLCLSLLQSSNSQSAYTAVVYPVVIVWGLSGVLGVPLLAFTRTKTDYFQAHQKVILRVHCPSTLSMGTSTFNCFVNCVNTTRL